MRWSTLLAAAVLVAPAAAGGSRAVRADGVQVTVPAAWTRLPPAADSAVSDPRTILVVGTRGVARRLTSCQIAAYRVHGHAAVVVIVRWRTATSGGGHVKPGRWPLTALTTVHRPSFECFSGRGAAASLTLGRHAYQVNVMVGDDATPGEVAEALAVGRSFRPAR